MLLVTVLTMISYLQQFTYVNIMPAVDLAGRSTTTETLVLYVYTKAFSTCNSATPRPFRWLLMAIILIITLRSSSGSCARAGMY